MPRFDRISVIVMVFGWLLVVSCVYMRDVGRGFVKEDFGWIAAGQAAIAAPAAPLVGARMGFYRPVVDYTFAMDFAVYGAEPRGYGFTNLALYACCGLAVWALARAVHLSVESATIASVLWGVNPHGINMALVWISGRTSLCLTLFATLSAAALLCRRYVWTSVFLLLAMLSKEEAIVLPAILLAWVWLLADKHPDRPTLIMTLGGPVVVYCAFRISSGAMTPATAPSYYLFSFSPLLVFRNLLEYVDRGASVFVGAFVIALATTRRRLQCASERQQLLLACAIWFAGGYALTLFLPVRSSLYALFPSVGAALACAASIEALVEGAPNPKQALFRFVTVTVAVIIVTIPVYRARNGRYVEPARFSERALTTIHADMVAAPPRSTIVLHDVADPMSSFVGAFGSFAGDAILLHSSRRLQIVIEPPAAESTFARPSASRGQPTIEFATDRGRIFKLGGG